MNRVSVGRTSDVTPEAERRRRFEGLKRSAEDFREWLLAERGGEEPRGAFGERLERLLGRIADGEVAYEEIRLGRNQALTAVYLFLMRRDESGGEAEAGR